jgi:hypothetical protein
MISRFERVSNLLAMRCTTLFSTVEKQGQQVVFRGGIQSAVPEFVTLARTLQPKHSQT